MFSWALNISCAWVLFLKDATLSLPSCFLLGSPLAQHPLVLYLIILSSVFHCNLMSLFTLVIFEATEKVKIPSEKGCGSELPFWVRVEL